HPHLRSFPTRRSSDLGIAAITVFVAGLGASPARAATPLGQLRNQIINSLKGSTSHSRGFFVTVSGLPGSAQLNGGTPFLPASNRSEEHTSELQSPYDL